MQTIRNTPGAADTLREGADKINANFSELAAADTVLAAALVSGNISTDLVVSKASGHGLKVDNAAPTFGWRDLIGPVNVSAVWQTNVERTDVPTLSPFRGTYAKSHAFKAGDKVDQILFHIPHDYVPGTDIFLHVHWGHNGDAISGSFVLDYYAQYAKGHNQALFNSEINIQQTILTPDVSTVPKWQHRLDELRLSLPGGDATHLDTDLLEVDGLIILGLVTTTIPTITGSAALNRPYIFTVDVHYQSTGMATKEKAPDFYT